MPWLQLAVCAIEQGFVGIVRARRRSSDLVVDTVRDWRFFHTMVLVLLVIVDQRHMGHGGVFKAGGGHGGVNRVEVSQTDAEAPKGEERVVTGANGDVNVGEVDKLGV